MASLSFPHRRANGKLDRGYYCSGCQYTHDEFHRCRREPPHRSEPASIAKLVPKGHWEDEYMYYITHIAHSRKGLLEHVVGFYGTKIKVREWTDQLSLIMRRRRRWYEAPEEEWTDYY